MQSTINKFFDAVLVTNLDHRTDRMDSLMPELEKFNIEASKTKTFNGHELFPTMPRLEAGYKGTILTHLNALRYAKQNNLKNILILEDDVRFSEKYIHLLDEMIKELPEDWDMFYVGGNDKHPLTMLSPFTKYLRKIEKLFTTHAYSVNARCFDFMIKHLESNIENAIVIDVLYTQVQPQLNCYMATPNLAWQQEGFSDVVGRDMNYNYMIPE